MNATARPPRFIGCFGLALGLITFALYLPALWHGFLDYDDQEYVTANSHVLAGLSVPGLKWAFGAHVSNWHPLTWLSHMLDCEFYGLKPAGHHLTNVLLHVANSLLLFLVLVRLTSAVWRSAMVAGLFAWHPLHVESVAWISERKDVLSACFGLLTLWAYARYAEIRDPSSAFRAERAKWYALTLLSFTLGLMSKPMLVTWPFVLLLLDWWPLQRLTPHASRPTLWPLIREKIPFFTLSAAACALTLWAQRQSHSIVSTAGLPIGPRISHALISYVHYLRALFVPRRLAVYYPYETLPPGGEVLIVGILLALICALAFGLAARRSYLAVGWL